MITSSSFETMVLASYDPNPEHGPDSSGLREIVRTLKSLKVDEEPVVEVLTGRLQELFGMASVLAFTFLPAPGRWLVDSIHISGLSPTDQRSMFTFLKGSDLNGGHSFSMPEQATRNRAVTLPPAAQNDADALQGTIVATELNGLHQMRLYVCTENELLLCVCGFREKAFSGRDQFLLGAMIPALLPRLRWEREQQSARVTMAGLVAALEVLPCAAYVVRGSSAILYANSAGRTLCDRSKALTLFGQDEQGGLAAAPGFELKQLETPGMEPHYLVTQTHTDLGSRIEELHQQWSLTRRQREVLALLVQGQSNREIADQVGCALRTAELHVSNLIHKAGCSSRTELTMRFWGRSGTT